MPREQRDYWKKSLGIELFKINWFAKYLLYHLLGVKLPKLADQREYWEKRGQVYYDEITNSKYLDREVFFQDLLIDSLRRLDFSSAFEAGCGFGWNLKRIKDEFPWVEVGGLDFSQGQLLNAQKYMNGLNPKLAYGNACRIPFRDNAFDLGFTVGVFMNIHPRIIMAALKEMIRVSRKYIVHLEYDENNTTPELRKKRAFKRNIISHDYKTYYEHLGGRIIEYLTYKDFAQAYKEHESRVKTHLDRWEGFEGPEKYVFILIEV